MNRLDSLLEAIMRSDADRESKSRENKLRGTSNELLDCVSRTLNNPMPRRQAVRVVMTGVAGLALMRLGINTAWAQQSCDCNGVSYDPVTQCCTPNGVQQKFPIVNVDDCPNRVEHPGLPPINPNGCGAAGGRAFPNRFGPVNFRQCCDPHDICFGTCNSDRDDCDLDFLTCLLSACVTGLGSLALIPRLLLTCNAIATTYFIGVQSPFGTTAYENAQTARCDCCAEESCGSCSSPAVCGSFSACGPGFPCLCFTGPNGEGVCARGDRPLCDVILPCTSSSQCPTGFGCAVNTCCGASGVCVELCPSTSSALSLLPATVGVGPTPGHP